MALVLSKYHAGEDSVHARVGGVNKAQQVAEFIRLYMPDQHRLFFENLPLFYISTRDSSGHMWGSVLIGPPGFIVSPSNRQLAIKVQHLHPADPTTLHKGSQIGALGLELQTRRRNRMNGTVVAVESDHVLVSTDFSFGNCPKYIQARVLRVDYDQLGNYQRPGVEALKGGSRLGPEQAAMVRAASTMFVATSSVEGPAAPGIYPASSGCDMSHRGGPTGFVKIAEGEHTTLKWADYVGNNMFMTLGNLAVNANCGLLFIDYVTGDTLHLTGTAAVDFDDRTLPGAQRSVTFTLQQYVHIKRNLPLTMVGDVEFSPYLPAEPVKAGAEPAAPPGTQLVEVLRIIDEAPQVKTFMLRLPAAVIPSCASALFAAYKPGQYAVFDFSTQAQALGLTGDVTRTWTISYCPYRAADTAAFSITVKRVGRVTGWMHDNLKPGDQLAWRAIAGDFTLGSVLGTASAEVQGQEAAPAAAPVKGVLLLAGGIGITPFRPMLKSLTMDASPSRPVTLLYSARTPQDAPFLQELRQDAANAPPGAIRVVLALTAGAPPAAAAAGELAAANGGALPAKDVVYGRVNLAMLQQVVGTDVSGYVAAMCGPEGFMQACEVALAGLGVPPERVHRESFDY